MNIHFGSSPIGCGQKFNIQLTLRLKPRITIINKLMGYKNESDFVLKIKFFLLLLKVENIHLLYKDSNTAIEKFLAFWLNMYIYSCMVTIVHNNII